MLLDENMISLLKTYPFSIEIKCYWINKDMTVA